MIFLHNVSKNFSKFEAIKSVTLQVKEGHIHGIIGPSGAGKSTLLRLINLLERPDSGEVEVNGEKLTSLSSSQLRKSRQSIGMIFQHFNLVSNKTIYENVITPLELARFPKNERKERVMECLNFVGLAEMAHKYPAQISGGQKQRVAIARALANRPSVLLCDEPTSSLDPNTTAEILSVLKNINETLGVTIVIVSHEMDVIKSICNMVTIVDGGQVVKTISIEPKGIQRIQNSPEWFIDQLTKDGEDHHA